ncbi:MAG: flagellar motor switch protein FliG [Sulfobacillus acidophilus]|uniref:Flagellar motor switch protein FliG n=1 Tax=Sulfobacillus acidophilus TaxID=53633 RepID=A0A2T2WKP2_9FIRM|nr:MAG: flagellar motor switch protein FliG [Sulfobacillus acidophilus]
MDHLSGARKAAVLLLSVNADEAAAILRYMNRSQVEAITVEIAKMKRVDAQIQDAVLSEFNQLAEANRQISEGGAELAEELLARAFDDERADDIMRRLRGFLQKRPFETLRKVDAVQVLGLVRDEHPQTIAVVLSHLDPAVAAAVLANLPIAIQGDVARRIARMGRTVPEVMKDVEQLVDQKLADYAADDTGGGLNIIVAILNNTESTAERQIMMSLDEEDPELAETIRNGMFVFEDILQLDSTAIQKILRRADNKTLATALKGANPAMTERVFQNLSQKAGELLKEDMEVLGPVRIRDVEHAQHELVNIARQLEDAGEIIIARGEKDDFIV